MNIAVKEQVSLICHCLKHAVAQFVSDTLTSGLQPASAEKAMPVPLEFS